MSLRTPLAVLQRVDPAFAFMVIAVVLALSCSLTLRAMLAADPVRPATAATQPANP